MTKKDFQLIAATLASLNVEPFQDLSEGTTRLEIATHFADALARTNPRFKRDLFVQAVTGQVSATARRARTPDELRRVPVIRMED